MNVLLPGFGGIWSAMIVVGNEGILGPTPLVILPPKDHEFEIRKPLLL
jgi:hypothetical protein